MPNADVSLTTRAPRAPNAEYAFEIDFVRGVGSASRVFAAIQEFIRTCEKLDRELVASIDSNIETVMVLEDIEAGSIKTWFKTMLQAADDQALKELDWKPQVGKYLVRAKYAILRWTETEGPRDLGQLGRDIANIARETDVRHLPDYAAPTPAALIEATGGIQRLKEQLLDGDRAFFSDAEGEQAEFNLSVRIDMDELQSMAIKETLSFPIAPMILAVKRPDYLGESKWDFRHGRKAISATIEDKDWLRRFQARRVDVRPGDALRADVRIEHLYGHDNELLAERYTIVTVGGVLTVTPDPEPLPFLGSSRDG